MARSLLSGRCVTCARSQAIRRDEPGIALADRTLKGHESGMQSLPRCSLTATQRLGQILIGIAEVVAQDDRFTLLLAECIERSEDGRLVLTAFRARQRINLACCVC
jgi:hypothetical protein